MADDKIAALSAPTPPAPGGFGSKLLDQAKRAREQATAKAADLAAKAGEMKDQATSRAGEMKDQAALKGGEAAARAGEMKDQAAARAGEMRDQAAARATEIKDAGFAKVAETIEDFNAALPVLRQAGYALAGVDLAIGLPPKISANFTASDVVSEESFEQLVAENADKKLTLILLRSLHQAWRLQMRINIVGLKPKGISIEIGLIANVTVKFA